MKKATQNQKQKTPKDDAFESNHQIGMARTYLTHLLNNDTSSDLLGIVSGNQLTIIAGHLSDEQMKNLLRKNFYTLLSAIKEPEVEILLDIGGDVETLTEDLLSKLSGME